MRIPNKKYNTIVIDPPWEISMTGKVKRRENRAERLPYKTMNLNEIRNFPIHALCKKGCHVYCWTTNKMLQHTFDVLKSWGVNFHLVMPIVKPSGIAPCMGYVFASEFVLLGFFGKPMQKFKKIGKLNWLKTFNKAGNHSAKPEEFYNLVREMSPEPRIDIFARRIIEGFDSWGDQAPTGKLCPKCKRDLFPSDVKEYEYVCYNCDENFYNVEVKDSQKRSSTK